MARRKNLNRMRSKIRLQRAKNRIYARRSEETILLRLQISKDSIPVAPAVTAALGDCYICKGKCTNIHWRRLVDIGAEDVLPADGGTERARFVIKRTRVTGWNGNGAVTTGLPLTVRRVLNV